MQQWQRMDADADEFVHLFRRAYGCSAGPARGASRSGKLLFDRRVNFHICVRRHMCGLAALRRAAEDKKKTVM